MHTAKGKGARIEQIIDSHSSSTVHDLDLPGREDLSIPDLYDLYDLYDPAHVAGWEQHNLHVS